MLIVNTNTGSLTTQAALNQNTNSLQTAMTRLSTGLRINSAADDPSGLNIAQKMQTRVTGLDQANQNTYESISLAQTADSAMTQMYNNLNRMRQIAVQAANGTTNRQDRAGLQKELNQLAAEVTRITNSTEYNGRNLFSSSQPTKKSQYLSSFYAKGVQPRGFRDKQNNIDFQIGLDGGTGRSKKNYNFLELNLKVLSFDSRPTKRSYGLNTVKAARQYDFTSSKGNLKAKTGGMLNPMSLSTVKQARKTIDKLDQDIVKIADVQAVYGALQNRFTQVQNTNTAYNNALNSGRSRIMDADFAKEASNMTKYNILQQSGTAMLRQANTLPQAALTLLQ
jgi:flagellin